MSYVWNWAHIWVRCSKLFSFQLHATWSVLHPVKQSDRLISHSSESAHREQSRKTDDKGRNQSRDCKTGRSSSGKGRELAKWNSRLELVGGRIGLADLAHLDFDRVVTIVDWEVACGFSGVGLVHETFEGTLDLHASDSFISDSPLGQANARVSILIRWVPGPLTIGFSSGLTCSCVQGQVIIGAWR